MKTDRLERELKEAKKTLNKLMVELEWTKWELAAVVEPANKAERMKKEVAAKAVDDYKVFEEFKNLVID